MNRQLSAIIGIVLILLGASALVLNLAMPVLGLDVWRSVIWRFWPLTVVGLGLLFVLLPLLASGRRGMGALFIPGMPVLTTGSILLFTSVFHVWGAWEWLWPLEVLGVALGFLFAAIWMRSIWLLIPAIILGANGVVFQFCALTGLWRAWAVLWTIEPLAVGLALLLIGAAKRLAGLFLAGTILCGVAGVGLVGMTLAGPGWWLIRLAGPVVLIGVGFLLFVWGMASRRLAPAPAAE
jgi:hypothetical protein